MLKNFPYLLQNAFLKYGICDIIYNKNRIKEGENNKPTHGWSIFQKEITLTQILTIILSNIDARTITYPHGSES